MSAPATAPPTYTEAVGDEHSNASHTKFCPKCGTSCAGMNFCSNCGTNVRIVTNSGQPQLSEDNASSSTPLTSQGVIVSQPFQNVTVVEYANPQLAAGNCCQRNKRVIICILCVILFPPVVGGIIGLSFAYGL